LFQLKEALESGLISDLPLYTRPEKEKKWEKEKLELGKRIIERDCK
jgi:hypothetical protein